MNQYNLHILDRERERELNILVTWNMPSDCFEGLLDKRRICLESTQAYALYDFNASVADPNPVRNVKIKNFSKIYFHSILIIKKYICTLFNNLTINYQNNLGWIYYLGAGYRNGINQFIGKCYNDILGLHIIIIFNYRSYIILWFIWWVSLCASF